MRDTWDDFSTEIPVTITVKSPVILAMQSNLALPDPTLTGDASCKSVTLRNTSPSDTASNVVLAATGSAQTAIATCVPTGTACGGTLAAGASCNYGFRYTGFAQGDYSGTWTVKHDTGPSVDVTVTASQSGQVTLAKDVTPSSVTADGNPAALAGLRDGNWFIPVTGASAKNSLVLTYAQPVVAGCVFTSFRTEDRDGSRCNYYGSSPNPVEIRYKRNGQVVDQTVLNPPQYVCNSYDGNLNFTGISSNAWGIDQIEIYNGGSGPLSINEVRVGTGTSAGCEVN